MDRWQRTQQAKNPTSENGESARLKAARVLVVEDNAIIGMLYADLLEEMGHTICAIETTENGAISAAAGEGLEHPVTTSEATSAPNVIVKVSARERLFIERSVMGLHGHGYRPCTPSTR